MNNCWDNFFTKEIEEEIVKIFNEIGNDYFPDKKLVFRFTNLDLSNVKYIILGMDPYPSFYIDENNNKVPIATGRSFEVSTLKNWNSNFRQISLKNIVKTIYLNEKGSIKSWNLIKDEISNKSFLIKQPSDWFNSLERQGVMFLNTSLTVKPNSPGSHIKIWENFMNKLIMYIDSYNPNIKWISWGNESFNRISNIIDNDKIIKGVHPRNNSFISENSLKEIKGINFLG